MATYNDSHSLPRQPVPSYPLSIVDIFFPGFISISAAVQQLQAGDTNGYARILCICGIVLFLGKYAYNSVKAFVDTFTSIVHVSSSDEAYDMLITWVSSQPFARKAYSTIASVGSRRRGFTDGHLDGNQKKALQYSPWNGSFSFWYKNHMLTFQSVEKESRYFREEQVSVSCIGRNPDILRAFLSECRTEYLKLIKNKTSIFQHHNGDWKKIRTVDVRRLDTVILSDEKKTAMLDDVKSFLQSRTWYSERGIPYRRGYLLYGPPGTGKSSLSLSIAGECDLDIYILNLSSVDDDSLGELFIELPPRCVILLEDIDAVKAAHSRQRRTASTGQGATKSPTKGEPGGKVSLSALLNVVDGVGSQEGRLLIMTTNHIERLDAALIRPGRVDKKVKFDLTNQDIVAQLFYAIFRRGASDNVERAEDDAELKKLAADFASKVPEHEFSPADIQLFLLEYKESPRRAVENVQEWIIRAREENRHMTAAESEGSCGSIPASTPDILTTLDGIQAEKIASARPTTRTPQTTVFTHCGSCQLLQDVGRVLEAHQITELDHMTLGHLKLLTDFVRAEYIDTKLATPPSSPNLSSVTACEGRLLSTQPILKDSEHNPNLTELWPLGLAEESSRVKGPVAAVSSQPELRPGGGNATRPRFLNELTAEKISAYTDDVCSETTSDEASNGTSFEGESEPGNIMATISLDGSTISPLATLQEKEIAATMGDAVKSENPPTRSVELGYKTINEVWDSKASAYKIVESNTSTQHADEFDQYIFVVRGRVDRKTAETTLYIDVKSEWLRRVLKEILRDVHAVSTNETKLSVERDLLYHYLCQLEQSRSWNSVDTLDYDGAQEVSLLVSYLEETYADTTTNLELLRRNGEITFDLLWALFKPNEAVFTTCHGTRKPRCVKFDFGEKKTTNSGARYWNIECRYRDFDGKELGDVSVELQIPEFRGARSIGLLEAYPLQYHSAFANVRAGLVENGRKFVHLMGSHHRQYSGTAFYMDRGQPVEFNVDGRVMIDAEFFRKINPNYSRRKITEPAACILRASPWVLLADDNDSDDGGLSGRGASDRIAHRNIEMIEDDFLICCPTVLGFSFADKRWAEFAVADIEEIRWSCDAFARLAIPDSDREVIMAFVEARQGGMCQATGIEFDDIIPGKGRGLNILLHGNPGLGKTLTAEAVSEHLKRPLYSISAGELSISAAGLEAQLGQIFQIAKHWGAVLLLDEADVYLERRSNHDLVRNSLVSVFLRRLEYCEGIMFLTTNRISQFDEAILSRIHITLRYDDLDLTTKEQIWRQFLNQASTDQGPVEVNDSELKDLVGTKFNGRQIKNIVATAHALATKLRSVIRFGHLHRAVVINEKFAREFYGKDCVESLYG